MNDKPNNIDRMKLLEIKKIENRLFLLIDSLNNITDPELRYKLIYEIEDLKMRYSIVCL